jgi:hypothetical protein
MDKLSAGQVNALQNLGRKRDGNAVPFLNIADARALTELGYAERGRDGWDITASGSELLASAATLPTELGKRGSESANSPGGEKSGD